MEPRRAECLDYVYILQLAERSTAAGLANQAWIAAREQGDFSVFQPHLEKLMDVNRRYGEVKIRPVSRCVPHSADSL